MALAPQISNVGSRGQDARYDISGLTQVAPGVFTDGVYQYDANGLDLSGRHAENIAGLPGADEHDQFGNLSTGSGGGGGGGGGIPGAAVLAQMGAEGLAQYKKALARFNQQRQNTATQYGYKVDVDPEQGTVSNMRVDSANPYGIYQTLRHNNATQYRDLRDQAFDRGLGGKGLGAQGVSEARFSWGSADAAMAQALTQTMQGFDQGQQDAYQQYQNLLWQIELERVRELSQNMPVYYPPSQPYSQPDTGGGAPAAPQIATPQDLSTQAAQAEHLDLIKYKIAQQRMAKNR
jgi:hypothetical protein